MINYALTNYMLTNLLQIELPPSFVNGVCTV